MNNSRLSRRGFLRGASGLTLGVAVGGGALTAGCTSINVSADSGGGDLLERLRGSGTVRMGFANERPFGFINGQGDLTGEAPEVGKEIFRRLGVESFEPKLADFSSLIPGLKAGLFDVIAAGMYITPDRCAEIEFTNPDYNAPAALLLPEGNPRNLSDLQSIEESGARIGVLTGSVEEGYAADIGLPGNRIVVYPDQSSGIDGVAAGRSDCLMLTRLSLNSALQQRRGMPLEIGEPFVPVVNGEEMFGAGGFGFRKGETAIVDAFNRELASMQRSGEILKLTKPFGFAQEEMTDLTAADLCAGTAS
ncbi:ectoine/hydroxyectoine ABC transporter substrate-binding protein EhuB [Prauserella rugosa]|uniref:Amino acid ABC transporter substrate-binding protein (PAAT family) n=1 Tax=Prauserella rugosa TaxID=43354 RepID=A0A660CGU1_9PSEU|nr:ectoine/hydroxyectoine ABC transporter substrate-binding protein EhuB [Prauserella rugosa]KID30465.1 amino acid ABC transporter substrate-binding protein, PAAT family [Prauserella sp. Am3]KMS85434.1 amino acid ABC transporter substrate-binding protein [Streptomyces regensis]TWH20241.1 amino acid ABC transporter substrate-binding protein (PAAT family) [Prauserella rugosa]